MPHEYIDVFLRFSDAESALETAKALRFAGNDATELPSDGWWTASDGQDYYFALDVVFGTGVIEGFNGFHINGRWRGPAELLPDFGEAVVTPSNPSITYF